MAFEITTQAQYNAVGQRAREELNKPEGERNEQAIRNAIVALRAAENRFGQDRTGEQSGDLAPETSFSEGGGAQTEQMVLPQALATGALNRVRSIGGFVSDLFTGEDNSQARAEQRAEDQLALEEVAERFGLRRAEGVAETIGSIIPDVALGGLAGLGRRATTRVALEAGAGALSGAADADDPLRGAAIGATSAATLGVLLEVPQGIRDFVMRDAIAAARRPQTEANQEVFDQMGVEGFLSETSQDQRVASIQAAIPLTPGSPRAEAMERRQRQLIDSFARLERRLNPEQISTSAIVGQLKGAFDKTVSDLSNLRGQKFRDALRPAVDAAGATIDAKGVIRGGERVIPLDNTIRNLEQELSLGLEDAALTASQRTSLEKEIARLKKDNEAGGLQLGTFQRRLADLSRNVREAQNTSTVRNTLTAGRRVDDQRLLDAALEDLELAARSRAEIAEPLRAARAQYAEDTSLIRQMESEAVTKILGKFGNPADEDFVSNVMRLPAAQFRQVFELAGENADALRGRIFTDLMNKHRRLEPSGEEFDLNLGGFVQEFQKMSPAKRDVFLGVTPKDGVAIKRAVQMLQLIRDGGGSRQNVRDALGQLESLAINSVSRDAGFITRLIAGNVGPAFFEQALFTTRGLNALRGLGTERPATATIVSAVTQLARLGTETDAKVQEARERAQRQRQLETLSNRGGL